MAEGARRSVKAGFVLDQLALNEKLGIEQDELNAYVIEQAYRMGVQPDRLAQELTDRGQIGSVVADVLRGKALSLITEQAEVTDEAGQPVDIAAALRPADADEDAESDTDEPAVTDEAAVTADDEAAPADDPAADDPAAADEAADDAAAGVTAGGEAASTAARAEAGPEGSSGDGDQAG